MEVAYKVRRDSAISQEIIFCAIRDTLYMHGMKRGYANKYASQAIRTGHVEYNDITIRVIDL